MHVFYAPDIEQTPQLPPEEAAHAIRVLRLKEGDELTLCDGHGSFYRATIAVADQKHCLLNIVERQEQAPLWKGHIHLAMAPTKLMERNEWLAEKATEIGLDELTFLDCRYSERRIVKTERIEKILVSAIKQSLKARLPRLNGMTPFAQFVTAERSGQKFIAHCYPGMPRQLLKDVIRPETDATVLIGPEGDFSTEEVDLAVQHGYQPISLGPSRLRTETAALVATHLINLANQI